MALLRVYRADVPVAEVDLSSRGLSFGAEAGDDVRLDQLGVRAPGHPGGRIVRRAGGWALAPRGPGADVAAADLHAGERVVVGDGALEVVEESAGPTLDLSSLPPDDAEGAQPVPASGAGAVDERLRLLDEFAQALDRGASGSEAIAEALEGAVRAVRAERGFAALLEPDGKTLRVVASKNLDARDPRAHVSRRVLDMVLNEGREVFTGNAPLDIPTQSVSLKRIRSVCGVPLRAGGRTVGVLYVDVGFGLQPFAPDDFGFLRVIGSLVSRRLAEEERQREAEEAQRALEGRRAGRDAAGDDEIAWGSPAMTRLREDAERLVRSFQGRSLPLLISGESGTGKEVLARWLHARVEDSRGGKGRFVAVNCAAIPRDLAESELFGIEQGVATGVLRRLGRFQQADGGTLFLDEVGEMDLPVQAKVLRALESRRLVRVGGRDEIPFDVRVISATNRPLDAAIRAGTFREDLYWRLCGLELRVPPLRERAEDVAELVRGFARRFAKEYGSPAEEVTPAAMERLVAYRWPGNVRELRQRVGAMVVLARGSKIDVQDLPPAIFGGQGGPGGGGPPAAGASLRSLADVESEHIRRVLDAVGGDVQKAADVLGIHRKTLQRKRKGEAAEADAGEARD